MSPRTTHTPGPWFYELAHEEDGFDLGIRGFRVLEEERRVIAEIFPRPYQVFVHEANARLMAAAPEMKELLRECLDELAEWTMALSGQEDASLETMARAKALLNRIDGVAS